MLKDDALFVGAGKAEICFPQELFPIEGFQGVHDAPAARVLLLSGRERVAFVCVELVMLPPDGIAAVKKAVAELANMNEENIWVHTTHVITTPHAPHAPRGMGGVKLELGIEETEKLNYKIGLFNSAVLGAVRCATERAVRTTRAAKMGVGSGECRVNVNRDVETPFGWWINFDPAGPSNHVATVLRFEDLNGAVIACLISYGLKPCAIDNSEMEKNTRLVSSDVPGLACRLLEEQIGGCCLFAMSAAGDQVPLEQAWYSAVAEDGSVYEVDQGVQAGLEIVDRLGTEMAQNLVPVIEGIECNQEAPEICVAKGGIDWPGKERGKMVPTLEARYEEKGKEHIAVMVLTIGDVALAGLKPEMTTQTEMLLHSRSPYPTTLVVSMVNGGQKYMPDLTAYEKITWEAQSAPFMPGAAEAWVDECVKILKKIKQDV